MAKPTTRATFKENCLRRLGKPVIEINVDDDQVEDRIDEAIDFYYDYHFDGTEKLYFSHQINANTISTQQITVPENIIGVTRVFPIGDPMTSSGDIFNIRYQIALNDLYTLVNTSVVPYYMAIQHLGILQEIFTGEIPIRYNRHQDIVHLDVDVSKLDVGDYLILECYGYLDPDTYTDMWSDRWLQRYATQLIKRQWGANLTKFEGLQLPGGVQFNGAKILDDAQAEIEKMETDMIEKFSLPVMDMIG